MQHEDLMPTVKSLSDVCRFVAEGADGAFSTIAVHDHVEARDLLLVVATLAHRSYQRLREHRRIRLRRGSYRSNERGLCFLHMGVIRSALKTVA